MDTKRKGFCTNFGNCKNADNKIPVEVDISADFVCTECNRDLIELNEKKFWKKYNKKYIAIGAIILVVAFGVYFGIMKFTRDVSSTIIDKGIEAVTKGTNDNGNKTITTDKKKSVEPTTENVKPNDEKEVIDNNAKNIVTKTGNEIKTTKETGNKIRESGNNSWKTLNFPNGDRYVGEIKNGLMHGAGAYYFATREIISKKDLRKRYAEAGDVLKGNWYEGNFSNGKLYDKNDKLKDVIIIGQ